VSAGVNNKLNFDKERYRHDDKGATKFDFRPATKPSLYLNFLENPSVNHQGATISCVCTGTTSTFIDARGILRATGATNTCRFNYDIATGACLGLMAEGGVTNLLVRSRTLDTTWTASNVTVAVTQTGLDDTANSASLLTATAGNGTVLQSVTSASGSRVFSAYVKRITGTGTISLTLDGGSTYTDVTSSLQAGRWIRVKATQTLANPNVGFKITTSDDAIAVDYCQLEAGTYETSPVLSVAAQGVRQPEAISVNTLTPWYNQTAGTFYATGLSSNGAPNGVNQYIVSTDDTTSAERQIVFRANSTKAPTAFTADGGVTQITMNTGTWSDATVARMVFTFATNNAAASFNGAAIQTDGTCTMPTVTNLKLGVSHATSSFWDGHIRRIMFWPLRLPNAYCVTLATA